MLVGTTLLVSPTVIVSRPINDSLKKFYIHNHVLDDGSNPKAEDLLMDTDQREEKKRLGDEKIVMYNDTMFVYSAHDEEIKSLGKTSLNGISKIPLNVNGGFTSEDFVKEVSQRLEAPLGQLFFNQTVKIGDQSFQVFIKVYYVPEAWNIKDDMDLSPDTMSSGLGTKDLKNFIAVSSALNSGTVFQAISAKVIDVSDPHTVLNFAEVDFFSSINRLISELAVSPSDDTVTHQSILRNLMVSTLPDLSRERLADVIIRKDADKPSTKTVNKIEGQDTQHQMGAIVMPVGHGKTTLAAKHPDKFIDVDSLITDKVKLDDLKKLREEALKTNNWDTYNNEWHSLLKTALGKKKTYDKLMLLHSLHDAKALGINNVMALIIDDVEKIIEILKKNNLNDKIDIAKKNYVTVLSEFKQPEKFKSLDDLHRAAVNLFVSQADDIVDRTANHAKVVEGKEKEFNVNQSKDEPEGNKNIEGGDKSQTSVKKMNSNDDKAKDAMQGNDKDVEADVNEAKPSKESKKPSRRAKKSKNGK